MRSVNFKRPKFAMNFVGIFVAVFLFGSSIVFRSVESITTLPWTTEQPVTLPPGRYSAKPLCLAFNLISKYCLLDNPILPCQPLTTTPCPTPTPIYCTCQPCTTGTWAPTESVTTEQSYHTGTYRPTIGTEDPTASDSIPVISESVSIHSESPIVT